jgi:glycosyltransferase involved in cell wall biosynthesis
VRRPRIVHLVTRLELGGAQQNTLYCVLHHDRARFEVGLWAGQGGLLDPKARAIPDADVRLFPWLKHPIAPVRDAASVLRLARRLAGVDLVHTHSSKAGMIGRAAARLAGVRAVVHTVHGWSFNPFQSPAARRAYVGMERIAARFTDRLICVAEADRATGLALGIGSPPQYRIVRSGIDTAAFARSPDGRARVRASLGLAPDAIVVGTIANLKPQKAPLDFVEAARLAAAKDERLRFVYAGDGEQRGTVERAIASAGLSGKVTLLGWRDDVRDLLSAMDVFVLTSRFEGLPRAVLQAMAASVPVVVTDTGGVADVVLDGVSGRLVPPAAPAAAAEAIVGLASDPERRRRLAVEGLARLSDEFESGGMLRRVEAIYDELLGREAGGAAATFPLHLGAPISKN